MDKSIDELFAGHHKPEPEPCEGHAFGKGPHEQQILVVAEQRDSAFSAKVDVRFVN